jgi:Arc/MetJ-type ribon-helix-helix transcriptional regulator
MTVSEETTTVALPSRVVTRVEDRLPRTEFDSAEEYVTFVLEEVLYRVEQETADDDFEGVDEDEVRQRLEALGYLDE